MCFPFHVLLSADTLIEWTKTHHSTHKHIHASAVQLVTMMAIATNESNCVVRSRFLFNWIHAHKHTHIHTHSIWPLMVPYGMGHIAHQLLFALLSLLLCVRVCLSVLLALMHPPYMQCTHVLRAIFPLESSATHRANVSSYINDFSTVAFFQLPPSTETIHSNSSEFPSKNSSVSSNFTEIGKKVKIEKKRRTYSALYRNSTHILSVTVFWKRLIKIKYTVCQIDRRAEKKASNWYSKQRLFHHIIITTIETECVFSLHYQK